VRHLLFFLLLFIFGHSHAQDYIVNVQQFGIENGLAGRDVGILFIDRDGFLWISGHNYFQRYDGYDFKSYDLEGPGGKVHSIHSISQDEEGWLRMRVQYETTTWQLDILFFDPISGEVVSKEKKLDRQTAATLDLLSNTKKFAASSKPFDNSREYFSGTKNIIILDYTSKHLDTIPLSSSDDEKHSIQLIDHNGNFWMTKSREEECLLKANSKGVVQDSICPEEENRFLGHGAFEWNNQVYLIGKDRLNAYIGLGNLKRQTNGQDFIYKVNESGNLQTIFKAPFGYQVFKFFDGRIWCIGALGWKVYKLDGTFEFELNRADYGNALFENFDFASFIKDKSGKIYFGTAFGLNIIEAKRNPFKNYYSKKKNEQLSINNSARGIYEMEDEIIVNFEFGALVSIPKSNPDTFEIHASHSFNGEKTGKYNGRPILRDKNDNFLIGEAGYIRKWSSDFYQQEKIQLQEYIDTWSLWIDEEGCIWAGVNNGLAVTCDKQTSFTEYANKAIGIAHDRLEIYQIQSDSAGLVWLSTTQGLYAFDKNQKKVIEHYHSKGKGKYNLPAKLIYYLHIDKDNNKWFGTSNGLVFWNNKTNEKKLFNRNDGLSNNVIYAIKEDDYNRLWLSSDYGIMSFDKKSFAVRNYLPKDGTSDYEFNRVSHHQSKNGRIYFGSLNGVTSFHPKDFVENEKNHQSVAIANYEIFDGAETKLLNKTKELSDTKIITFHPRDRYFKLKFVLPTFDEQNKILYGWKMESVYEDWTYQKENTLQFSAFLSICRSGS